MNKSIENIITGLECMISSNGDFMQCPYRLSEQQLCCVCDHCCSRIAQDAIDILVKLKEPRLLSLEEVAGRVVLEQEEPIYIDFGYIDGEIIELIPKYAFFDDENGLTWHDGKDLRDVSLEEYNDIWRCWSGKPTDEQVAETPWGTR